MPQSAHLRRTLTVFLALLCCCSLPQRNACAADADQGPTEALIAVGGDGAHPAGVSPTSSQVTIVPAVQGALDVHIAPGKEGYPGINIKPPGATWDLARFGHVEVRATNTGAKPLQLSLRVDDDADPSRNPWNAEFESIPPGESKTVRVRFGYSFGKRGYHVNPAKIARVLVYCNKSADEQSFRIASLTAGGKPGEKPARPPGPVLTVPKNGVMLGAGVAFDPAKQVETKGTGVTSEPGEGLRLTFAENAKEDAYARLKPPAGHWDLRAYTQVTLRAKNVGTEPSTLRARLESQPGGNAWIVAPSAIAPGATQEIILPFAGSSLWNGTPKTGPQFSSDQTTAIAISATPSSTKRSLLIESVRAERTFAKVPDWLGKRPPVEGKWTQTLDENFDGMSIDKDRWLTVGENYYDSVSHFSPANAIVNAGMAHLRFERKRGRPNDDPKRTPETDYATGFLSSYGKWTQRYGYFESRMKLPTAPGLWPAFWMMPDRGPKSGAGRGTTSKGGMEFDIMEYMTRYGPNRYNIAMHWDDYGKDHKSTGTENIYVAPDTDGFITAGLLWEPGRLTYFCNGVKVAEWDNPRVASVPAYLMYTFPSGGWGGNALDDDDAGLPADFVIDWVRAWQRADLAEGQPTTTTAPTAAGTAK